MCIRDSYYDKPKYEWDSATYSPLVSPQSVFEWQNRKDKPKDAKPPWDGREYAMTVREHSAKPMDTHLLIRGNAGRPSKKVEPEFLNVLSKAKPAISKSPNPFTTGRRLALARWIANPEHPLTARVMANRIWQFHFGKGIVSTSDDFGLGGAAPTHPELLDWLAVELQDRDWNLKVILKLMVTSRTFRQSSAWRADVNDPENRLRARGPGFRLDAESVRDVALWASGLLDKTMGGEGVKPYQPGGLWKALMHPGSNTKNYVAHKDARQSVSYTHLTLPTILLV